MSAAININTNPPGVCAVYKLCKACRDRRCHTKVEWRNHPLAGHGYTPETGWTHPEAERLSKALRTANASRAAQPGTPEVKHGA